MLQAGSPPTWSTHRGGGDDRAAALKLTFGRATTSTMPHIARVPSEVGSSREDELARVRAEAERARDLVATHSKVHELIAAGAPLEDCWSS
jgi:hypothetical protein